MERGVRSDNETVAKGTQDGKFTENLATTCMTSVYCSGKWLKKYLVVSSLPKMRPQEECKVRFSRRGTPSTTTASQRPRWLSENMRQMWEEML